MGAVPRTVRAGVRFRGRENTRRNFWNTLDLFEELCSPTLVGKITEQTVSAFVTAMRKRPVRGRVGMKPSTITVRLRFLHTALRWGVRQKLLAAAPEFPQVKVPKRTPKPVPVEAFDRLLEKADDLKMTAYLMTAWLAGLRLREALDLEWRQTDATPYISADRKRIVLPAQMVKSDEDEWIPLDPELLPVLEQLPDNGPKVFRFVGRGGKPILGVGSVGPGLRPGQ